MDNIIKVVVRGKEYAIKLKHAFELLRNPYIDECLLKSLQENQA